MRDAPPDPLPPDAVRCISGLAYQVLQAGSGDERPGAEDVVQLQLHLQCDAVASAPGASDTPGAPQTLAMKDAAPGLAEALQLMTPGQRMRLWIPPPLSSDAWRASNPGTLVVDVTLIGFTRTRAYPALPVELRSPRKGP